MSVHTFLMIGAIAGGFVLYCVVVGAAWAAITRMVKRS